MNLGFNKTYLVNKVALLDILKFIYTVGLLLFKAFVLFLVKGIRSEHVAV